MAGKFRGRTTWDPILIIYQILTVQLLSYASLSLLIFIAASISGYGPTTEFIFNPQLLRFDISRPVILAHILNGIPSAYLVKSFVERSKLCLDFTVTHFVINFILVWHYNSMPDSFLWYFINILSSTIMCVTSEFLCRQEEMKSIPISATV